MSSGKPKYCFSIELCPPLNPQEISAYYEKIKPLLGFTNKVSISSHPVGAMFSGFDRSYNLAQYLQKRKSDIDILLHITCRDMNRVNIGARLCLLKKLGIKRILVISGEHYTDKSQDSNPELLFANSSELLQNILLEVGDKDWFNTVAVGGYPPNDVDLPPSDSTDSNYSEQFEGIKEKFTLGADTIYTQCIFDAEQLEVFNKEVNQRLGERHFTIVPSIAIFQNHDSLCRCLRLTRVQMPSSSGFDQEMEQLKRGPAREQRQYCKNFLINMCRAIEKSQKNHQATMINICPFGLFDSAAEIIEELMNEK